MGVPKILLRRGINPEKRGLNVEMEGHHFYYFTVQLYFLCVCEGGWEIKFPLLHFGSLVF